jgi:hypothetical protein
MNNLLRKYLPKKSEQVLFNSCGIFCKRRFNFLDFHSFKWENFFKVLTISEFGFSGGNGGGR